VENSIVSFRRVAERVFLASLKGIAGLVLLAACASGPQTVRNDGSVTGALTPQLAVDQFLKGANAKDIQAMGIVFGTKDGPARETMDRTELEKRLIILACYFNNDSNRTIGEERGVQGHRELRVELKKGNMTRVTTFYTIQGPGQRWYVDNIDIAAVRDFCGNSGTGRTGR
jgi:hypothetical protein